MMHKKIKTALFAAVFLGGSAFLWAQNNNVPSASAQKDKLPVRGQAYLADDSTYTGNISVERFLQLIGKPIHVKDSDGKIYTPTTFAYTYAERGAYEDEAGKPIIVTDYLTGFYEQKLDTTMLSEMYYRAKPGDTAFIEKINFVIKGDKSKGTKTVVYKSKPIKLILTQ